MAGLCAAESHGAIGALPPGLQAPFVAPLGNGTSDFDPYFDLTDSGVNQE